MRLFPVLLLTACGVDSVGSNGELGHLSFSLASDWYIDTTELTEVAVVTNHAQSFGVSVTDRGDRVAHDEADRIRYAMDPAEGVTIEQGGPVDDEIEDPDAPSLALTVADPGVYTLSAVLDGELFDRIQLTFDAPVALELALYSRAPWEEEFEGIEGDGPTQVREGAQLAWLPIPLAAGGERLAGDVATTMSADPIELVVPADNVDHVNEDEVYDDEGVASLYFIEAGDVTVTITDSGNPAQGDHAFTVVE